jgi:hypothetical protein
MAGPPPARTGAWNLHCGMLAFIAPRNFARIWLQIGQRILEDFYFVRNEFGFGGRNWHIVHSLTATYVSPK